MNSEPPSSNTSPIIYLAIGFVIGAVVVGSSWLTTREPTIPKNMVHNVSVTYMYETSPGNASGRTNEAVDSVLFHPGYVIVTGKNGQSNLFSVDRLRQFSFAPTDSK